MAGQEYIVFLHTPLGKRRGELSVQRDGTILTGTLTILNHTLPFSGRIDAEGNCKISGEFITLIRTVAYVATGRINDKEVCLEMVEKRNHFELSGFVRGAEGEML